MDKWRKDYRRFSGDDCRVIRMARCLKNRSLRALYYLRKYKATGWFFWQWLHRRACSRNGLELSCKKLGGCLLAHPYNITINSGAEIGEDFTIFKGATIGSVRSGKRAGVPKIGDRVTVCPNAMVCGAIIIGNDVLIAANAFVNMDVPDHSIVVGNPASIRHKENASKDYTGYV